MRGVRARRWWSLALAAGLAIAATGCNSDVGLLVNNGMLTLHISVNPDSLILVINGNPQTVGVSLARQGDTGPVNLTTSGVPAGVTTQTHEPGMLDNGSVTFQATSNAQPVSNLDVAITANDGRVFDTTTVRLTITR